MFGNESVNSVPLRLEYIHSSEVGGGSSWLNDARAQAKKNGISLIWKNIEKLIIGSDGWVERSAADNGEPLHCEEEKRTGERIPNRNIGKDMHSF